MKFLRSLWGAALIAALLVLPAQAGHVLQPAHHGGGAVTPPPPPPPGGNAVNTFAPRVMGGNQVGQTIYVSNGTWTNTPSNYNYTWFRDGTIPISGPVWTYTSAVNYMTAGNPSNAYTLTSADVGHSITAKVAAVNASGVSAPVASQAFSNIVTPATVTNAANCGGWHSTTYGDDGCSSAPTYNANYTLEHPDFFTGYAKQSGQTYGNTASGSGEGGCPSVNGQNGNTGCHPPWAVAGVDYPVGVSTTGTGFAAPGSATDPTQGYQTTGTGWRGGVSGQACSSGSPCTGSPGYGFGNPGHCAIQTLQVMLCGGTTPVAHVSSVSWSSAGGGVLTVNLATPMVLLQNQPVGLYGFTSSGAAINGDYTAASVTGAPATSFTVALASDPSTVSVEGTANAGIDIGPFDFSFQGNSAGVGEGITINSAVKGPCVIHDGYFLFDLNGTQHNTGTVAYWPTGCSSVILKNDVFRLRDNTYTPAIMDALWNSLKVTPATATWAVGVTTYTVASPISLTVGTPVYVAGFSPVGYNGVVIPTSVNGNSFTASHSATLAATTVAGTASPFATTGSGPTISLDYFVGATGSAGVANGNIVRPVSTYYSAYVNCPARCLGTGSFFSQHNYFEGMNMYGLAPDTIGAHGDGWLTAFYDGPAAPVEAEVCNCDGIDVLEKWNTWLLPNYGGGGNTCFSCGTIIAPLGAFQGSIAKGSTRASITLVNFPYYSPTLQPQAFPQIGSSFQISQGLWAWQPSPVPSPLVNTIAQCYSGAALPSIGTPGCSVAQFQSCSVATPCAYDVASAWNSTAAPTNEIFGSYAPTTTKTNDTENNVYVGNITTATGTVKDSQCTIAGMFPCNGVDHDGGGAGQVATMLNNYIDLCGTGTSGVVVGPTGGMTASGQCAWAAGFFPPRGAGTTTFAVPNVSGGTPWGVISGLEGGNVMMNTGACISFWTKQTSCPTTVTPPPSGVFTPIAGNGSYKLVFDDEFNGSSLDTTVNWSAPGNHTDNTYSGYSPALTVNDAAANTTVHGGCLDMASAFVSANNYSTSGIVTKGSVTGPGVYWEERVKMPTVWNGESFDGGWTDQSPGFVNPEIDTMEFWTTTGKTTNGWNPGTGFLLPVVGASVTNPTQWHVFASWWTSSAVTFYLDGVQTQQYTNDTNQATPEWYSIVTSAMCSHNVCGGQPDGTGTGFPAHLYIDYIHVYALNGAAITPQTNYGGLGDSTGSTTCTGN